MLKAVTFDLWNTVIKEKAKDSIEKVAILRLKKILDRYGEIRSIDEIIEVTTRCRDKVMKLQVNEGKEMPRNSSWIILTN